MSVSVKELEGILSRITEVQEGAVAERRLWAKAVDEAKAERNAERKAHAETKAELTEAYARRDVVRATHAETKAELTEAMKWQVKAKKAMLKAVDWGQGHEPYMGINEITEAFPVLASWPNPPSWEGGE